MTNEQYYKIFEYWKSFLASQVDLCDHSVWEGGPSYVGFDRCNIHKDVKYGGQGPWCGTECPDFTEASPSKLMVRFNTQYAKSPERVARLFDAVGITDYTEDDLKL